MRIVQGDAVAPQSAVRHRGGGLQARILLEGASGTPGNFQLSLSETGEDFVSPRHRHNFEQYRVVLEGTYDFGPDGVMSSGTVGYFPEGVYYGPQTSANDTLAAVLQFGGASGGGYLSGREVEAGMEGLQRVGEFRNGVFQRHEGAPGRRNQDAFEAIWEFVNGKPLAYPSSTYGSPTLMDPAALSWTALDGGARVAEKRLGSFWSNRTSVRMLELREGARFTPNGRGVFLVLSGTGMVGTGVFRRLTALYLEAQETVEIEARELARLLHFELPNFS